MEEKLDKLIYYGRVSLNISKEYKDDKYKNFIFVLFQNSIFGEYGLTVPDLESAIEASQATVRKYIKRASNYLYIEKDSHAYRYSMNLNINYSKYD